MTCQITLKGAPKALSVAFFCTKTYKSTLKALVVAFSMLILLTYSVKNIKFHWKFKEIVVKRQQWTYFLSGKRVTSYLSRQWKDLHKAPSYAKLFGNAPEMGLIDKEHSLLFFLSKSIIWLVRPCWFHVTWFWFPFLCRKLKNNVNNGPNLSTKPRMSN